MVDVIFDTNIYGKFVEDIRGGLRVVEAIAQDPKLIIHNFRLIRNELRKARKLLPIYDRLTTNKIIQETSQIKDLANEYFEEYRKNKGMKSRRKILNDFKIVACASIKNFDIVFSEDNKTLKNPISLKAYKTINLKNNYRTPTFYSYTDLKKRYLNF